jgi:hypothetical protein
MSYRKITTYGEAFPLIDINDYKNFKGLADFLMRMELEGHSEKSIAFTIWKKQEKLRMFRRDERFFSILKNEIKKYSWTKDDPRWEEYNKKKAEAERMQKYKKEIQESNVKSKLDYVYFIQGVCGGAIKIGRSKDPEMRLKTLQTGYPDTLHILLLIPGSAKIELQIHEELEQYRLNGEWFKPEKPVMDKIKELKTKQA